MARIDSSRAAAATGSVAGSAGAGGLLSAGFGTVASKAVAGFAAIGIVLTRDITNTQLDQSTLMALGFTRRQLSATIAWQATGTIAVGVVIGVPLGIVLGRLTWKLFAQQLDVVAEPAVPIIAISIIVLAAVVVANVLAALPGRYARAVPAALALRDE